MADGIKFLIELDSKTKGAADAIRGLGGVGSAAEKANEHISKTKGAAEKANEHISKTKGAADAIRGLGGVGSAAEKANEHIKGMGEHGKGLSRDVFSAEFAVHALEHAWEGAKWAAEKVRDIVKETINTMADAERSRMALTNLMGSEGAASSEIKFLEKFSQLTEFSKKETEGFGISLMKAGYKGQDFEDALAAVADAASLSSDKVEGAQSALSSLTRMKLTGKLDARSLKGLGLDARDVVKDLGGALGMTPESVKKQLEAGAIPAAAAYGAVLRAIERKTGKGLGEAGLAAGTTLSAKLTHLGELPGRIMAKLEGSPAMERIKDKFDKMLGALDPDSPKGQKIIGGLERIMGAIADVDFDPLISVFTGLPQQLGTWVEPLSKIIALTGKLAGIFLSIPQAIEDAGDALEDLKSGEAFGTHRNRKITAKARQEAGIPALQAQIEENEKYLSTPFVRPEDQMALARFGGGLDRPLTLSSMRGAAGQGLAPIGKGIGALVKPEVTWNMTNHIHVDGSKNPEETTRHIAEHLVHHMHKRAVATGVVDPKSTLGTTSTGASTGTGAAP